MDDIFEIQATHYRSLGGWSDTWISSGPTPEVAIQKVRDSIMLDNPGSGPDTVFASVGFSAEKKSLPFCSHEG